MLCLQENVKLNAYGKQTAEIGLRAKEATPSETKSKGQKSLIGL